jgi:hypothetical protein
MPQAERGDVGPDWYGHLQSKGDYPSLLARRYRSHGHHDDLSRHEG